MSSSSVPFAIRTLDHTSVDEFWTIRLQAIQDHPEMFAPSVVDELQRPWESFVHRYLAEWISGDSFILGAYQQDRLVGVVGCRRWTRQKTQHKGYIWLLYVVPSARSLGIGRQLLQRAIHAAHRLDLEQLSLHVATESHVARKLYSSLGFASGGIEPRALKLADRFVDSELMVLMLSPVSPFYAWSGTGKDAMCNASD